MPTNQSNKTVQITVTGEFYEIMEKIAAAYAQSVEEYLLDETVKTLAFELEQPAGPVLGFAADRAYREQLEELLSPTAKGGPA